MSIRKKLFLSMLLFSVTVVLFITGIAVKNTYNTMEEELIYNRRMSIGWLQDRLELMLSEYQDRFYGFEVERSLKEDIESWCVSGQKPDYAAQWRMITAMNEAISMDSNINSIEIINLLSDQAIVAERTGASIQEAEGRLEKYRMREEGKQSNLVFMRDEKEILVAHAMHRFFDKLAYAVIIMHIRPYEMQDILKDIKMTPDETVMILNDEYQVIEADYGELSQEAEEIGITVAGRLLESDDRECHLDGNFWFCREVSGGKLKVLMSVSDHVIKESLKGTYVAALISGGLMLFFCAFWATFFSDIFSKSIIAQEYQLKLEKREAQIRALQAQINPHFMYNILQVIGGMALNKNAPEIYRVTSALGDLMRYCLNFSREMVSLKEELHYLQSYCTLQNERFNGRIRLELTVEERLLQAQIPKLILQPVLENSFHHGLVEKSGDWVLFVKGEATSSGDLLLTVGDNGIGIGNQRLLEIRESLKDSRNTAIKAAAHIGLQNINARIKLQYGDDRYGVELESEEGKGTTVFIRMKLTEEEQNEPV